MNLPRLPLPESRARLSVLALTAPVAMGYIPLGAVFGFLFVQAGAEGWLAILASLLVYAGAAQYMMIPMLAAGMSLGAIALATLLVNVRHVFYGLSLLNNLPQARLLRWYLVFGLTDETYSVLTTMPASTSHRQMVLVAFLNQAWWVLGTVVGVVMGARVPSTLSGLDFVLAALFAVLTVEQWRTKKSAAPVWVALVAYAVAYSLAARHALVVSILFTILASVILQYTSNNTSPDGSND